MALEDQSFGVSEDIKLKMCDLDDSIKSIILNKS